MHNYRNPALNSPRTLIFTLRIGAKQTKRARAREKAKHKEITTRRCKKRERERYRLSLINQSGHPWASERERRSSSRGQEAVASQADFPSAHAAIIYSASGCPLTSREAHLPRNSHIYVCVRAFFSSRGIVIDILCFIHAWRRGW